MAAFGNVGKAVLLSDASIGSPGRMDVFSAGRLSPHGSPLEVQRGSADPGRAPRAHRNRAKVQRGIWVLFHVEIRA